MLVLSRKVDQAIRFPDVDVEIRVLDVKTSKVQIGIEAPPEIKIRRGEQLSRAQTATDEQRDQSEAETVRLHTELLALAELAAESNRDAAEELLKSATERLHAIRQTLDRAQRNPLPISELIALPTNGIDRVRRNPGCDELRSDRVRQSSAGYEVCGRFAVA